MPYRKPGSQPGHGVRLIGGRKYNQLPSEQIVAKRGAWILVTVPELEEDGWLNFKIFVNNRSYRKRMWPTGIKDGRVARGDWIAKQMTKHKGLYEWASWQMQSYERRHRSSSNASSYAPGFTLRSAERTSDGQ